jgi:UDP-N-acetylmuramoyl-tripeptide--D-alanyl-D-alanine ligase
MLANISYQIFYFISLLWFVSVFKNALFYFYLWQLKEYHIGRFLAHFDTKKGKSLFFNPLAGFKIILILAFPFFPLLTFFGTIVIYLFGFLKIFFDFIRNRIKKPVLTKKALFLIFTAIFLQIIYAIMLFANLQFFERFKIFKEPNYIVVFAFWLLLFDVLSPLIISGTVLLLQPLTVLFRSRTIKKAQIKRGGFPNLLAIGITGSYGKTSTKEFLAKILSEKFNVLKTKEHQNSEIGISMCILNELKPEHEVFIAEMGAYNRGGIKLLCGIIKPKIGVLTGINEQHMATFGSQENIIKGKYELVESLPKDGAAFFNSKNKYCLDLYEKTQGIKKYLYGKEAGFFGEENFLGAISVAKYLGMTDEEIKRATDKIDNKMPGIKILNDTNGLVVIDATYSANPDGVIANLEYLSNQFPKSKKIIVMPCLIELGKASKEVHQKIGKKIAEVCDLAIITTLDKFDEIKAASAEATASQGKPEIIFMENPKKIFEKIKNFCRAGDVILLESRVPKKLINQLINK